MHSDKFINLELKTFMMMVIMMTTTTIMMMLLLLLMIELFAILIITSVFQV